MATTAPHRPPQKPLDLEITIVSAKHLKNVNWRNGDLNPYAIFWLDPDRRLATKSDDSNSTKPVWNERFLLPLPSSLSTAILTLEIFHSKPSDTPKPLVGTLRVPIDDLPNLEDSTMIRTFELRRPSGRPSGKIRLKLSLRERPLPDYQMAPQPAYYYNTAPASSYGRYPPPQSQYNPSPSLAQPPPPPPAAAPPAPLPPPTHPYHYGSYSDPYSGYYQGGYYSQPPPPQTPRPYTDRPSNYGGGSGGPSAPVDYAQYENKQRPGKVASGPGFGTGLAVGAVAGGLGPSAPVDFAQYENKQRPGKVASGPGFGTGLAVGAVAGGLGGLALDEGLRYEEEKVAEKAESDMNARELDDYSSYRRVDY